MCWTVLTFNLTDSNTTKFISSPHKGEGTQWFHLKLYASRQIWITWLDGTDSCLGMFRFRVITRVHLFLYLCCRRNNQVICMQKCLLPEASDRSIGSVAAIDTLLLWCSLHSQSTVLYTILTHKQVCYPIIVTHILN